MMKGHRSRGLQGHMGNPKFRRAMVARRWMKENPTNEEIVAMLEEYQRDLEQEVANVAERIRRLQEEPANA